MDFCHSHYVHTDNDAFVRAIVTEKLTNAFKDDPNTSQYAVSFYHKDKFTGLQDAISSFSVFGAFTTFQNDPRTALLVFEGGHVVMGKEGQDVKVFLFGPKTFISSIEPQIKGVEEAKLRWVFKDGNDIDCAVFPMVASHTVHDEFYPFIHGGVSSYFDAYMKSSASVLIMMGDSGTGKTSLIRWFIDTYKLSADVTYDESVLSEDGFFINYLTDTVYNLLVVEDADLLLTSRESDANKLMAKLLNVSDGLVKLLTKKVIFSTNLPNTNKIDTALIRPGRCFDILRFRPMTQGEADVACSAAGLPPYAGTGTPTLADLFNRQTAAPKVVAMGFNSRRF